MFAEKIELKDFEKMNPEYRELLGRVLTIQADCEIGGRSSFGRPQKQPSVSDHGATGEDGR